MNLNDLVRESIAKQSLKPRSKWRFGSPRGASKANSLVRAILLIFLIEASVIGFIGGIGGTVLGALASKAVEAYGQVHPLFYFRADVSSGLVTFGLTFSFLVGSIAGLLPARQAEKLKPVEALRRYE